MLMATLMVILIARLMETQTAIWVPMEYLMEKSQIKRMNKKDHRNKERVSGCKYYI